MHRLAGEPYGGIGAGGWDCGPVLGSARKGASALHLTPAVSPTLPRYHKTCDSFRLQSLVIDHYQLLRKGLVQSERFNGLALGNGGGSSYMNIPKLL
jgi:hypothetical protein